MSKLFTCAVILLVALAACAAPATPVPPTATPAPTDTPAPTLTPDKSVTSLQNVKSATIQIEAQGSFVDPEVGLQLNAAGRGSGFIIDESGLAVTNNHVVTGAALLKVWVGGESKPRNAKIVAVSECSDLALIDIDGDGYPFLTWYQGELNPGLDVYAAGFPLGDPEYTLTRGIISKARADGETVWASVDAVIEHDATINPGNSGGPLITKDGQVAGINYAASLAVNQYQAIARDEALKVIGLLRQGQNVDGIGLNGTAVNDGESLSGVWAASVRSGSPADKAGIQPGDIVTKLEGLVLATDGTLADYCDILRTHHPDDTLNIQVVRFATKEVLEGQINGRKLEQAFSFAETLHDEVPQSPAGAEAVYSGYTMIYDDSQVIQIGVPVEWDDINGLPWTVDDVEVGAAIVASSDLQSFYDTYTTPGVFFGASRTLAQSMDEAALLDENDFSTTCTYEGRYDYEDPAYTGMYDLYSDCDGQGSTLIQVAAAPADRSFIILLQVLAISDADLEALDYILQSFEVVGELE
ncbi:MAG: peptidase S1 [Chloroflexi bacterium HGW-Chloroflexi-1]|nr:MAG: peptidase S1 [Chloroflexi bacterium HGW-Chloroflexi-1]